MSKYIEDNENKNYYLIKNSKSHFKNEMAP